MPNMPMGQVPNLAQRQGVSVTDIRVLPLVGLQFTKGGCDIPGMVIRCEVVDIPRQTQYIIPFNIGFAERLHKQLGELITEHNKRTLEK